VTGPEAGYQGVASPVGVVEWNAAAYFAKQPALHFASINGGTDIMLE